MKGFKGFDKDFKCRGFQYAIGEIFKHDAPVKLCSKGLHFVENPLDVFGYYPPNDSRYAEVEAEGVSSETESDSKRVAKSLKISAELSLKDICDLGVKFMLDKVDFADAPATNTGYGSAATNTGTRSTATNTGTRSTATNTGTRSAATNTGDGSAATNTGYGSAATNTGDGSAATNTGYGSAATNTGTRSAATNTGTRSTATNTGTRSAATNTGDGSAATNTGYGSAATNTGKEGCAISLGIEGKAKGSIGCWLTLAEWKYTDEWHRIDAQTKRVDGMDILPDTFYMLKASVFVSVE